MPVCFTLTHNVEAQLVAQLVPQRVVGVVGAAHGVEVEALHQADVLQAERRGGRVADVKRRKCKCGGRQQAHGS